MGRKFSDNALTTLASSITNLSTTLTVATGKGANFPAATGRGTAGAALDYFVITMEDASGNREKIKVEERVGDALGSAGYPLVRGYDGTIARSWTAGDSVDLRLEKAGLGDQEDKVQAAAKGYSWGNKDSTTAGLNYGYFGGIEAVDGVVTAIADGTVALTASQTNHVERTPAGAVSANITGFSADKIPMAQVVTGVATITGITDKRPANLVPSGLASFSIAGGAGSQTATADQARAQAIELTGALTGNRDLVMPNMKRAWIFYNNTSGAFAITVKVSGQTGFLIPQGKRVIAYCDGTDVREVVDGQYRITLVYTATGANTWTKPAGLKRVRVTVVAGGGGGAGGQATGAGTVSGGGSGAGGGISIKKIEAASLGSTETATVGAGGAGGASTPTNGATGGTSSFGAHCSATGGTGGVAAAAAAVIAAQGGAGGTGTGGDVNSTGQGGGVCIGLGASNAVIVGTGGSSVLGGGAQGLAAGAAGNVGGNFGGGGGACVQNNSQGGGSGGAGAQGVIIVEEFY